MAFFYVNLLTSEDYNEIIQKKGGTFVKVKIVGVCSCPAGVAHTYMAADKLTEVAKKMGYDIIVETQGMAGIEDRLQTKDLEEAKIIILANEVALREPERFEGYEDKIVKTTIHTVLHETKDFLEKHVK